MNIFTRKCLSVIIFLIIMAGKVSADELLLIPYAAEKNETIPQNTLKNWFSAEFGGHFEPFDEERGISIGARYERMLGRKISLGIDFYWFMPLSNTMDFDYDMTGSIGVDGFFRYYPRGRIFFMGLAFGYYYNGNGVARFASYYHDYSYITRHSHGFAITAETGLRINIKKAKGFFIQPGIALGAMIRRDIYDDFYGNITSLYEEYENNYKGTVSNLGYDFIFRIYLGLGYAF